MHTIHSESGILNSLEVPIRPKLQVYKIKPITFCNLGGRASFGRIQHVKS